MNDRSQQRVSGQRPLPGTGRLGIVSGCFQLAGLAAAFVTVGIATAAFLPRLGWTTIPRNPWVALVGATLMTIGYFRTAQLLRARRKAGAELALASLLGLLVTYSSGAAPGGFAVSIAAGGLALIASVWRYLE
jgi:hypothetical protein